MALIPRTAAIGRYVTPDELIWVHRSLRFRQALLDADWANTIQSGHPGVITTWLGAAAAQFQLWLRPESRLDLAWIDKLFWLSPDNGQAFQHLAVFLTPARLMTALATTLGVLGVFYLGLRRFGWWTAALGAFLLASDPFVGGLSGLLHVDGLLATWMLLAVLLLLPPLNGRRNAPLDTRTLILAGLLTSLAILTKSPGLVLLALIPAMLIWRTYRRGAWSLCLRPLLLWAAATIVAALILLPALWADPGRVLDMTSDLAGRLAESAVRPTFFRGQVTLTPGPTFYPLAVLFRLSPAVTLGLIAAALRLADGVWRKRTWTLPAGLTWPLLMSAAFLFLLNLSAKRFDRYALPAVLGLILVSAWGLAAGTGQGRSVRRGRLVIAVAGALQLAFLLAYLPYPLTAYNWLVGGSAGAQQVLPAGWGEAASAGAKWAADQPGAENQILFTTNIPAAAPFFPGRLLRLEAADLIRLTPGDTLLYVEQDWQLNAAAFVRPGSGEVPRPVALAERQPAETISFKGLPRAALYTGLAAEDLGLSPLPLGDSEFSFAGAIRIVGVGAYPRQPVGDLPLLIAWQADRPAFYNVRLFLVDENGDQWAQMELPLLNDVDHPAQYWPVGETFMVNYQLSTPADLPPGPYTVQASLFDEGGARQGVFDVGGRFIGVSAPIASLVIEAAVDQPGVKVPIPLSTGREVAGYRPWPPEVGSGEPLKLDIWWRQAETTPPDGQLLLQLGEAILAWQMDTAGWRPGQIYHLRPEWQLPPTLPAGDYPLSLQLMGPFNQQFWPEPVTLGGVKVVSRSRNFDLPSGLRPLGVLADPLAYWQWAAVTITADELWLDVVWQGARPDGSAYTVFVHLRDSSGALVDQGDRPPIIPTGTWVPGQVIEDRFQLQRPPPGDYTLAVGFYDPDSGLRLPTVAADGQPLPDDQYVISLTVP